MKIPRKKYMIIKIIPKTFEWKGKTYIAVGSPIFANWEI